MVNISKPITTLHNTLVSAIAEKKFAEELDLIVANLNIARGSSHGVDRVIYDNDLLKDRVQSIYPVRVRELSTIFNLFIDRITVNSQVCSIVKSLFRVKIFLLLNREGRFKRIGHEDVSLVKELVWVSHYISRRFKNIKTKPEDLTMVLSALIGCRPSYLDEDVGIVLEKYLKNLLSLKNASLDFVPYPKYINLDDLDELVVGINGINHPSRPVIAAMRDSHDNRERISKMIVTQLTHKLWSNL